MHPSELVLNDPNVQSYLHESDPAWSVFFHSIGATATISLEYESKKTIIIFKVHKTITGSPSEMSTWKFDKRPQRPMLPYTSHVIHPGLVCEIGFQHLRMGANESDSEPDDLF